MPKPADQSCANCRYYVLDEGSHRCWRYPPFMVPKGYAFPLGVEFPAVGLGWWCGEWKAEQGD